MKLYEIWNKSTGQPFVWGEMSQAEKDDWAAARITELEARVEELEDSNVTRSK
jgi:hypothetical protein